MTVSKLVLIGMIGGLVAALSPVAAQQTQLSDKAVQAYMDYSWSIMPQKFTKPDGKVILIDKSTRDKVDVPIPTARDAVMAGRRSAYAQACIFPQAQVANYRSLMVREEEKKKWTDQQMMFINQIHLTTVMMLNGTIELIEVDGGGKTVKVEEQKSPKLGKPTDAVCQDIVNQIAEYVKAGPKIPVSGLIEKEEPPAAATAAAAAGAPTTTGATPAAKTTPAAATPAAAPTAAAPPKKP